MKNFFFSLLLGTTTSFAVDSNNVSEAIQNEVNSIFQNVNTKDNIYDTINTELKEAGGGYYADYLFIRTSGSPSLLQKSIVSQNFVSHYEREGGGSGTAKPKRALSGLSTLKSEKFKESRGLTLGSQQQDSEFGFIYKVIEKKNKEEKIDSKPIPIDESDFNTSLQGYQDTLAGYSNNLKNKHFLGKIVITQLQNIKPLIQKKEQLTLKTLEWMVRVSQYLNGIEFKEQLDYEHFECLYLLFQDIFCVFLAYQQNYTNMDYKTAMKAIHKQRLPENVQNFIQDSFITKSGMDSLTLIQCLLRKNYKDNKEANTIVRKEEDLLYRLKVDTDNKDLSVSNKDRADFFETYESKLNNARKSVQIPVCMRPFKIASNKTYFEIYFSQILDYPTTITGIASELFPTGDQFELWVDGKQSNDPMQFNMYPDGTRQTKENQMKSDSNCLEGIIQNILDQIATCGNAALVIDTTFQIPKTGTEIDPNDPTYYLLNRLAPCIQNGSLIVFLAKSYQKFATLGTQKTRAGDLTIICNTIRNTEFRDIVKEANDQLNDIFDYGKDPFQFVIHYLTGEQATFEQEFLKQAMDNAKYFFDKIKHTSFRKKDSKKPSQIYLNGPMIMTKNCPCFLKIKDGYETFGFLTTTMSGYGLTGINRLSVGIEPQNILDAIINANIKSENTLDELD